MAYPQKLLANDEQVEFELKPHWRSMLIPIIWLLVIVGVAAFLMAKFGTWFADSEGGRNIGRAAVGVVAVFLLIFLVLRPFLSWWSTQYVFTNRRIIVRTGVIARRGRDMPLSKVNNVTFELTALERLFNCGTLVIESASESGALVVANVPNVEHVQREVYRLHDDDDAYRSARAERYEHQFRQGEIPEPLTHGLAATTESDDSPAPPQAQADPPAGPAAGGSGG